MCLLEVDVYHRMTEITERKQKTSQEREMVKETKPVD